MKTKYQDLEYEIDNMQDVIRDMDHEFVNAKTFAERRRIYRDHKSATEELQYLINLQDFEE